MKGKTKIAFQICSAASIAITAFFVGTYTAVSPEIRRTLENRAYQRLNSSPAGMSFAVCRIVAAIPQDNQFFSDLSELGTVRSVTLSGNEFPRSVACSFKLIPWIEELVISSPEFDDESLAEICSHTRGLRHFSCPAAKVTAEGVGHLAMMPLLEFLDVSGNRLGKNAVEVLSRMTELKSLLITNTDISAEDAKRLQATLSNTSVRYD